jgi:hypothetical protein
MVGVLNCTMDPRCLAHRGKTEDDVGPNTVLDIGASQTYNQLGISSWGRLLWALAIWPSPHTFDNEILMSPAAPPT